MGKIGRFACILTPMVLTFASLICAFIIMIAGTKSNIGAKYWFFRINTSNISTPQTVGFIPHTDLDNHINTGFTGQALGLQDFYTSYLWNYCGGDINNNGSEYNVKNCSSTSISYAFNPEQIINSTSNASSAVTWPGSVTKAQKAINVAEKAMNVCYLLGFIATCATFVVGWFGLLSRWGSCVTVIFADIASFFLLVGSIISTSMFFSLKAAFNKVLTDFHVKAEVGGPMMSITWLAFAFSFGASFFWLLSTCCCSGRTSRVMKSGPAGKGANDHGYQRVGSPYAGINPGPAPLFNDPMHGYSHGQPAYGQNNVEMGHVQHPFEPMRHTAV